VKILKDVFKCGSLNYIHSKSEKFLVRIAREEAEEKEQIERSDNKKHTFRSNKKDYLNHEVVYRVLSVLNEVNLSDADMNNEDDATPKGKNDLIGLCLMASRKSYTNSGFDSVSEGKALESSYDDLDCVVEKLGTLLDKIIKKKKYDSLIEPLMLKLQDLKL
jgi:hypothetical protein